MKSTYHPPPNKSVERLKVIVDSASSKLEQINNTTMNDEQKQSAAEYGKLYNSMVMRLFEEEKKAKRVPLVRRALQATGLL